MQLSEVQYFNGFKIMAVVFNLRLAGWKAETTGDDYFETAGETRC